MKSRLKQDVKGKSRENELVTFLLKIPFDLWQKFINTVPISRTSHDFILDLIQRRVWEYEKASENV
jgi:hypothetical protein